MSYACVSVCVLIGHINFAAGRGGETVYMSAFIFTGFIGYLNLSE